MTKRKTGASNGVKRSRSAYVNSPLVEVVFEIRFKGEPAVECHRDKFFDSIRDDFPHVWVPNVDPGTPIAMQPYHFKSEGDQETVMVAINRFAFATKSYAGFGPFRKRALQLAESFCKMYKIEKLTRTGLRYVNLIPFLRQGGTIPWDQYFNLKIALPESTGADFLNAGIAVEARCKTGVIKTNIACGQSPDGSREVFLLDLDFSKKESLFAKSLAKCLDESHSHTKAVFEGIVAESYKAVMRGDMIQ